MLNNFVATTASVSGDKLDIIAIPDFAAGAENPNAITFRETALCR
jgi:aminopeptidase N